MKHQLEAFIAQNQFSRRAANFTALASVSLCDVGKPHRAEARVNKKIPVSNNRLRPMMSPSRPTLTIRLVMARR